MKRSRLKYESDDHREKRAERRRMLNYLAAEGRDACEICPRFRHVAAVGGHGVTPAERKNLLRSVCHLEVQGIHERRKRSDTGSMINLENLMPACNRGNGLVELFPRLARSMGLVLRPGDPDWERLGAIHDDEIEDRPWDL